MLTVSALKTQVLTSFNIRSQGREIRPQKPHFVLCVGLTQFEGSNAIVFLFALSSPFIITLYRFTLVTLSFFSFRVRFETISDKASFFLLNRPVFEYFSYPDRQIQRPLGLQNCFWVDVAEFL